MDVTTLVEAVDVRKSFESVDVLKGVSFRLDKGETLVVMGGSGSATAPYQNRISSSLVRKKSEMITPMVTWTTVAVVARPSPSVPPSVVSPL